MIGPWLTLTLILLNCFFCLLNQKFENNGLALVNLGAAAFLVAHLYLINE